MINGLVNFALNNRFLVLAAAILLFIGGGVAFHQLPVEAYPTWPITMSRSSRSGPESRRNRSSNRSPYRSKS